ncbi:response regulator [Paenibacillaceae bacterium]|nr:response regulator [Paenibacillaceae bacterium]
MVRWDTILEAASQIGRRNFRLYTIVLVDDEHIELDTLRHYIPWSEMGFEVVGVAKNGREALTRVNELLPDLVITDVKMPLMDGIQFAETIKKSMPSLKIIFMSGYNDFAYIKSALLLEASGYLLKPLDMEELHGLMAKVRQKFEEEERTRLSSWALAAQYARELLHEEQSHPTRTAELQDVLGGLLLFATDLYTISVITIDMKNVPLEHMHSLPLTIKAFHQKIQRLAAANHVLTVEWNDHRYITIGAPIPSQQMQHWHFELSEICPWVTTCVYPDHVSLEQLHETYTQLLQHRGRYLLKHGSGHYSVCAPTSPPGLDRHAGLIQQVQRLIEREYGNALTIDSLAESVHLSPNHLRALFKDHTGNTVHEYTTQVRLESAAELLRDSELKIHEIAAKVGYDSTSHFCALFHKKRGLTPSQYRMQKPGL